MTWCFSLQPRVAKLIMGLIPATFLGWSLICSLLLHQQIPQLLLSNSYAAQWITELFLVWCVAYKLPINVEFSLKFSACTAGRVDLLIYYLPVFTTLMILCRCSQQNKRNEKKLGAAWTSYCQRVPSNLIPKVFWIRPPSLSPSSSFRQKHWSTKKLSSSSETCPRNISSLKVVQESWKQKIMFLNPPQESQKEFLM